MIEEKLLGQIKEYCNINNIDCKLFVNTSLRKSLNIEKYGDKPPIVINKEELKSITLDEIPVIAVGEKQIFNQIKTDLYDE